MKKEGKIIALSIFVLAMFSVLAGIVAADTLDNMSAFLGSLNLTTDNFTIIMLGMLLWIVLFTITKKIFQWEGRWGHLVATSISLIIVILTFIYMPKDFITAIALQYSAMGATILTVIPFAILFYFSVSVSSSLFLARVTWVFYIVYYFSMFIYKWASFTVAHWYSPSNIPYIGAIFAGVIIFVALPVVRDLIFHGTLEAKEEKAIKDIQFRKLGRKLETKEAEARTGI